MTAEPSWWRKHRPALIVFVMIFGGLLYFATREFLPKRRVQAEYLLPRVQVTAQKPYELEWPKRSGKPEAPPLSLVVPHTAFAGWDVGRKIEVERLSTGHDRLYLFTRLPDPEGLSVKELGKWCETGLEAEDCSVAEIRILLMQDAPDASDPGRMVMDSQTRGSTDVARSGPYRKLNAFWVKEDREAGSLAFVGWDCEGEPAAGVVSTDVTKPLAERNRCFEPANAEERRAPAKAGYQRLVQLTACSGAGKECKLYFPFRGRYVEAVPTTPMNAKAEEATGHLFLASWEFLNRLYRDSRVPPSATVRHARADAARDNCREIEARIALVAAEDRNKRFELKDYADWQCALADELSGSPRKTGS